MKGIEDTATVTLNVNGAQAKQVMADLEAKIKQTETTIDNLKKSMADPKDIEKAKKQLKTYQKQLDEMRSATEGVDRALSNIDLATPRQLEKALRTLNRQLKDMKPGSDVWDSHIARIRELKGRLADLKGEVNEQQSVWNRFREWSVSAWPALDLIKGWYDSLIGGLREYVDAYAEMDQEMANVRKFTGMSEEQVASLNEEFKKMDTRSSREQLNQLAQEAGRLGKTSEEDVLGFVRAADKINVALDDLGEGATLTLSKLTGIFGDEERYGTEQSLLKVGSVINELSQNCSASAPYLTNFTERMGGVGAQANMTIPQIMGFAAVLDSNSQAVEASSTALSQVIVRLYQDPAKYAKVAGLNAQEFAALMREDANAALILFLETLQKAGGMDRLSPMFKDMGENGSRAIAALSTLATHIDQVKAQQEAANVAFREGTSIDREFAVQNGTVQAQIEKAQKRFQELRIELGEKLYPLMANVISTTSMLTRVISVAVDFFIKCRGVIVPLATAVIVYYTAVGIATAAQKAWTAAVVLGKTAVVAFKYTIGLLQVGIIALTHSTRAAGTAFTFLNATVKANPFGLAISLFSTLAVLVYKIASRTDQYTKEMKEAMKTSHRFTEETVKEHQSLDKLVGKMEGAKKGTKEYEDAKQAIINQYGQYLEGLINERGEITNLEEAYKRLSYAIRQNGKIRGIESARQSVNDIFTRKMVDRVQGLRESLASFGADDRAIERIVTAVENQIATGDAIPEAIQNELSDIQNSFDWDHLFNRDETPVAIFNDISRSMVDKNNRLRSLDGMEFAANPAKNASDIMLDSAIRGLERALNNLGDLPGDIVGVLTPSGSAASEYLSKEQMESLLANYRWERSNRNGGTAGNGNGTDNGDYDFTPVPTTDPTPTNDRFAEEKAWRARQEAEARIDYASGEASYSEHMVRMDQIAVDYYQKLLDRADVYGDEELSIRADHWEAINKHTIAATKQTIEEENRSHDELLLHLSELHRSQLSQQNMSAAEREQAERVYQETVELANLNHLSRLVDLYKEGSAERLQAQQTYQNAELAAQKRHQQEYEKQEAEYAKYKEKFFGDNPEERQQKYDAAFVALQEVYARELAAAGDNADEKLRIEEAFLQAQNALRKEYGLQSEEDTRSSYERIVFGFGDWLQGDGGKALTGTLSLVNQHMASIFSGLSSLVQAEMELQTAAINKKYDAEIQAAQGNSYKVAKLEKKKEKEIAKAKNEANKKMFTMQVIQAVAQSAQAGLNAYSSTLAIPIVGPALAPAAMALAIATGAIQVAALKKQQQASEAQGYAEGGFTKPGAVNEPAGIVHAGEWVASQRLLSSPVARPMIEALDYAQRTNTIGSLRVDDVSRSITAGQSLVRISETDNGALVMAAVASQMSSAVADLTDRLKEPFVTVNTVTGDKGIKQAQDDYTRLMNNVTPKSKRK